VDSHRGGLSIVLLGHDRSGRFSGWKALYFFHGSLSIGMMSGALSVYLKLQYEQRKGYWAIVESPNALVVGGELSGTSRRGRRNRNE
jgi:hypothetical protein